MKHEQLDARRLLCPMPVIKTQNAIKNLEAGDQLTITCSDPGTLEDIPTWSRINGHTILSVEEVDLDIIFLLEVGEE